MTKPSRASASYGKGHHRISDAEATEVAVDAERVVAEVRELFTSPDYRPPVLPAVAIEVHRLSTAAGVDLQEIVALLETDPILAAAVLRIAQSAAYARRAPPRSLSEAVIRLGSANVRDIVFQAALGAKLFQSRAYDKTMQSLRRHSVVTAHFTRLLASSSNLAETAFLCGLLHDVGLAAALIALSERASRRPVMLHLVSGELHRLHTEVGALVTRAWDLPREVQQVSSEHHSRSSCKLSYAVCIADHLANELGAAIRLPDDSPFDVPDPQAVQRACAEIRLDAANYDRFRAEGAALLRSAH